MKIAWICHFTNSEIQSILAPSKTTKEFAPWITQLAKFFEADKRIELHVVAPHEYISGIKHFSLRNIHYHFFNPNIILLNKSITGFKNLDYRSNFFYNKMLVRKIMKKIKPDLIHLHGAENAYYSSTILQFNRKYPVLVTIQGFISHIHECLNYTVRKRINIEKRILHTFNHFGYRTLTMGKDIQSINPKGILHWHNYPLYNLKPIETEKIFDFVFFAKLSKNKGIEDLLKAISMVKEEKTDVRCCIIGYTSQDYLRFLKTMTFDLGISDNIHWAGFLATQPEVHKMASSARISILPTYFEIISGTIIESLFLKLPVIAYDVGSIHEVNDEHEYIALVPKGDVVALAKKMKNLLADPTGIKERSEGGYKRVCEMMDNKNIAQDLLNAYKAVITDFSASGKKC